MGWAAGCSDLSPNQRRTAVGKANAGNQTECPGGVGFAAFGRFCRAEGRRTLDSQAQDSEPVRRRAALFVSHQTSKGICDKNALAPGSSIFRLDTLNSTA
jgi:hypothetical protein